jgi:hypothetical protein
MVKAGKEAAILKGFQVTTMSIGTWAEENQS